eukprot:TRINITY_DN10623_c0_g1_i1.p1 TRINITY_DN10623_c0_g1~~TRINITY_DN10623_c0_g1_i1.p1  ORF type:complete len:678 (+),score=123.99 TRINITY_DN10623_c0_g1_i1:108-2141(+)
MSLAPRGGYVPLGALPPASDLSNNLNRLTLVQLKPLLQVLNATGGTAKKQDIVDKIIATLAQRIASYNDALRGNQANVVELYWRQLREVVEKVNSSGRGAKLVLVSSTGQQALPPLLPGQSAAAPHTTSAAAHPPVRYAPSTAPPPLRAVTPQAPAPPSVPVSTALSSAAWMQLAESSGLKRKRDDEAAAAGLPAAKRQNLGSSSGVPLSNSGSYIPPTPIGYSQTRAGYIPNTNVCLEDVDDPFFRLAPYPALSSFQLDAAIPMNSAAPRSKAFQVNISEAIWQQMQGPTGLKAILRCFVITPVRAGSPTPEPAKHSWPHGAYIFINQQYVELGKYKKDEKKKTLEVPLDMNPWLKPGVNTVTIQATGMMNYQVVVQLMRPNTVTDMVEQTRARATISIEEGRRHVLNSFRGNGDDLVEMKKKVALSDPLVLTRIRVPARPSTCRHINCFDLTNFLLMNERIRTWRCPVCGSEALYKNIIVDGWMNNVLTTLGPDETEFVVYPDATWTDEKGRAPGGQNQAPVAAATPAPTRHVGTASVTPASARPKPISVITLDSDDDDDEPPKPPARQASPAGTSSDPEYGRSYLNSSTASNPARPSPGGFTAYATTPDIPSQDWRRATTVYPAASSSTLDRPTSSQTVAPAQTREQSFEWMKPSNTHTSQDDIQIDVIDLTDD